MTAADVERLAAEAAHRTEAYVWDLMFEVRGGCALPRERPEEPDKDRIAGIIRETARGLGLIAGEER